MPDSYDQASGQIDTTKRDTLAAMAAAGTAGVQAYQRAQADLVAQREAAVQQALAGAARMDAPQAQLDQLRATISQPYDRYNADITAARAYGEASQARSSAANAAYFDQAKAAIPALRNAAMIAARDRAAKAAGSGGGGVGDDFSDSELTKRLLGAGSLKRDDAMAFTANLPQAGGIFALLNKAFSNAAAAPSAKAYGKQAGLDAGLDPTRVQGLMYEAPKKPSPAPQLDLIAKAAGLNDRHAKDLRSKPRWSKAVKAIRNMQKQGVSRNDFIRTLGQTPWLDGKDTTKKLLIAEFGNTFAASQPPKD